MKRLFTFTISIAIALSTWAQVDLTGLYSNNSNINNANLFSSHLGLDPATVQVDIINFYGYAGVTSLNRQQLQDLLDANQLNNEDVDNLLQAIGGTDNQFLSGIRFQPLNVAFRIGDKMAFGFGAQERPELRFGLDGGFLELLWRGNGAYGGETVDLGNLILNTNYMREYYVAGAYSIIAEENMKVRVGGRLKVLQGSGAVYAPDNEVSLYTEPDGRYLDFIYRYRMNVGLPFDIDDEEVSFDPFRSAGNGFGIDLGGNIEIGSWQGSLGISDLGGVRYNNNVYNYFRSDTFRFEGVEVSNALDGLQVNDSAFIATLTAYDEANERFTVPLPAKIALQGAYRIKKTNMDGNDYYAGSVFLTLVQGLNNRSTFGTNTLVSLGGAYDFGNIANVGMHVSTFNFNSLRVGAFASFRLIFLRLGVGSSNLLPLVTRKAGLSTDIHFNLGINF